MTARGRAGKRKDGLPKGVSPFAAAKQGYTESRARRWDRIELKALQRTPQSSLRVTVRAQLATDMTQLADRGWQVLTASNRGLYNLNTVWTMTIDRAELVKRYGEAA